MSFPEKLGANILLLLRFVQLLWRLNKLAEDFKEYLGEEFKKIHDKLEKIETCFKETLYPKIWSL